MSTLPKKVQISVQNSVQPQIKFVQYSSVTVKLTISKKQFFLPNVGLFKIRSSIFFGLTHNSTSLQKALILFFRYCLKGSFLKAYVYNRLLKSTW